MKDFNLFESIQNLFINKEPSTPDLAELIKLDEEAEGMVLLAVSKSTR